MICSKAYWTTDFSPSGVKLEAPLWDRFWTVFSRWGTKLWPVPTWYGHDAMISWENVMGMSDYKFSENFESGLVSELEMPMIYPKVAMLMEKYAHSNPGILMQRWSSWARRLATTWSSGMVVCLASLTSWRRSEDVTNHANDMGMVSWEKYRKIMGICGIWSYLYSMVLRTLWEKT